MNIKRNLVLDDSAAMVHHAGSPQRAVFRPGQQGRSMSHHRTWFLAAACLALAASNVAAQDWPSRPIRAIVPVAAGSSTDIVPRLVFEQLSTRLGQAIVVENRTGAGGTIGSAFVAKAEPDGYTVLAHGSAHTIARSVYAKLSYDPAADLMAVVPLGVTPSVLVVAPGKGYKTAADLVTAGKARPGTLNFSSVGIGSATHLSAERFLASAGVKAVHSPFKGGAEAMSEAMAGWETRRSRREWHQAERSFGGRSDHGRGGHPGCRVPDLVRSLRAGEDLARSRREAESRDAESTPGADIAGPSGEPRCRPVGHEPGRVRNACPAGNRLERQPR